MGPKTKIGSRRACLALLLTPVVAALAAEKREKPNRKAPKDSASVAGTVFRDPGFALPGAQVLLEAELKPPNVKAPPNLKPMRTLSDSRGEFAFRVPPGEARYTVSVKAEGYVPQRKTAYIAGMERTDVFFQLQPAAK